MTQTFGGPIVFVVVMATLATTGVARSVDDDPKRPNVLLIHVDQLRIDCLGAYGNPDVKTPHIDQLADEGVRYANSFCPYPVCTPSRYSLLSGQYVHDHGGWNNRSTLTPQVDTFPRILRAAGYRTKAVGKMHFMPTYLDVGFDQLVLAEQDGPGRWDDDYHRHLMERGLVDRNDLEDQRGEYRRHAPKHYWETYGALTSNLAEEHHATTWIADRAVETLETWESGTANLLMVGFIKPHHPFDPPAPWDKMYDPEQLTPLPGWTSQCLPHDLNLSRGYFPHADLTIPTLRRVMAFYYATISQIDHHVGRMIGLLEDKGLYDNTVIVYTADHGDYMGFHHMLLKGDYMYDPLVKVPLIIKWPDNERAGSVSKQLVSNIDLAPTLCRTAGCPAGRKMLGLDLRSNEKGHRLIFAEHRMGREVMARSQNRKLILANAPHKNLFFDLEHDPLEMENLYDSPQQRDEIARFEKLLNDWRCKDGMPRPVVDLDAPQISQPNVPPRDGSHQAAVIEYYQEKMSQLQRRD